MKRWCYSATANLGHALTWPFVHLHIWNSTGTATPSGGAVLVSNHISHFDPLFLTIASPRQIDWMTTEEFYRNRVAAAWLRAVNTFPVDRSRPDRRALRLGLERLRGGRLIGVFPEGGIRAGAASVLEGAPPKSGATALARLGRVPIIPCVILGSDRLYAARTWRPGRRRTPVWVTFGPPLSVANLTSDEADACMAAALRELAAVTSTHFSLSADDWPATPQRRKGRDAAVVA